MKTVNIRVSTEEVTSEQVMPEDMGLGGVDSAETLADVSPMATPEVLISGDKLFHVQSYDIGGGQRRYDGIWMPGNDGRPVVYGWTLADLRKRNGELWQQGFRMSHQYSYDVGGGQRRY